MYAKSVVLNAPAVAKKKADKPKSTVAAARGGNGKPFARKAWENFKSIAATLAIFLFIRAFFVEAYRIPSGSMIPALLVGDWLFVNKLVYGPNVPFTSVNLPGYADPKRGEVVVFKSPYQPDEAEIGNDPTPTLVKRLVGMPGDTIYMREGVLHINGTPQRQGYGAEQNPKGDPNEVHPLFDWQKKVGIIKSRFGAAPEQPTHDNWGPFVVPLGHYFMMGDNRYNSKDSRYWGFVPRENVRGRPIFVYYTYVPQEESDKALSFITDIRWGRIGHLIK